MISLEKIIVDGWYPRFIKKRLYNRFSKYESWYGKAENRTTDKNYLLELFEEALPDFEWVACNDCFFLIAFRSKTCFECGLWVTQIENPLFLRNCPIKRKVE
jgi:hypothetical protein